MITPKLTVDAIVSYKGRIVLIERKNIPYGWALPGGFVDVGETVEDAVRREMMEEINVELLDLKQFHVYSDPKRDPRSHTVSVIFTAICDKEPVAGDDAKNVGLFTCEEIVKLDKDGKLCFDHGNVLSDYFSIYVI
ncbi:MAG: NUDIX hydrolase [Pseudomonadota bacterium]